jgi:hypothetical protein
MQFLPLIILSVVLGLVLAMRLFITVFIRPPSPVPVRRFVPVVIEGGGRKVSPLAMPVAERKDAVNE